MGTWAIQAAAHAALYLGYQLTARIRRRVGLMLADMLGDDDEELRLA